MQTGHNSTNDQHYFIERTSLHCATPYLYDTIIYTRTLISVHRTMTNKIHVCKHFYTVLTVHRTQNNHFDRKQHYPCRHPMKIWPVSTSRRYQILYISQVIRLVQQR
ncbi:hypothetical protein NP493_65g07080 [Ridgeia piscesae]|uniref:Uncharacterized protein n=1 Tax=Ridgeia piscesae TaxID=27915 RepID=A0AAD9P9Y0_RIDPI|nr:hypothetical protein NP493_65g07080 [Ridgeia piscesae]